MVLHANDRLSVHRGAFARLGRQRKSNGHVFDVPMQRIVLVLQLTFLACTGMQVVFNVTCRCTLQKTWQFVIKREKRQCCRVYSGCRTIGFQSGMLDRRDVCFERSADACTTRCGYPETCVLSDSCRRPFCHLILPKPPSKYLMQNLTHVVSLQDCGDREDHLHDPALWGQECKRCSDEVSEEF